METPFESFLQASADRRQEVVKLRKIGWSRKKIAAAMGISPQRVSAILKTEGVAKPAKKAKRA